MVNKGDVEDDAIAIGPSEENSDNTGLELDSDSYDPNGSI